MNKQKNSPDTTVRGGRAKYRSTKQSKGKPNFKLRQNTKTHNILKQFCKGKKLSCLDHYWLSDTCLHSTVSSLSTRYSLKIPRKRLKLPNRRGDLVSVSQYWFSDDDIAKIKPLLSEVGE